MTDETRDQINAEIDACRRALLGETVNGVKLGDPGITDDWLTGVITSHQQTLDAAAPPPRTPMSETQKCHCDK